MKWLFETKFNVWDLMGCLVAFTEFNKDWANALWIVPLLFAWFLLSQLMQKALGV